MTAAEIRAAMKRWGVQYREYPGWTTRKRPGAFTDIRGVIIHHTGSDAQSDSYLKWIFTEGRSSEGIPAPLCNVSTDMDGDVWLGAIGRANHAGRGSSATLGHVTAEDYGYLSELRAGPDNTDGNAHFYGNEVRYDGGQPMTAKQYASAVRWSAAICDHYGWSALSVIGHREWSSRKPDPGKCPMNKFRSDVAALLKAGPKKPPASGGSTKPPVQEDTMTPAQQNLMTDGFADLLARIDQLKNEVNNYSKSLDSFNDLDVAALKTTLDDHTLRLQRIEDDTDDGTVTS